MTRHLVLLSAALLSASCSLVADPGKLQAPADPGAPTGLGAVSGDGLATLSWHGVPGDVIRYDLHRGTVSGSLAKVAEVGGGTTTWTATGLVNGTTYYFAVAAVDSAGKASALSEETSATPFVPDTTPPTAVLFSPGDGATHVGLDATLVVSFSEAMAPGSVTITTAPALALGAPAWDASNAFVSFNTSVVAETSYTVNVSGADQAGNAMTPAAFHFSTVPVPPTLDAVTPSDGAADVPTGTAIQLVFSEPMDPPSVEAAFSARPAIACAWTWLGGDTIATCAHASLAFGTHYEVTVAATARDAGTNPMTGARSFSFTTSAAPHTLAPAVVSSSPAAAATGVVQQPSIAITFNEAVDKVSAQTAFQIVSPVSARGGLFGWSGDGLTMTYTPPAALAYGTVVQWQLTTALQCLGGISLAAQVDRSFTVIREGAATLYGVSGLDGYIWNDLGVYQGTGIFVGDGTSNNYERGFLAFDLSAIPASATAVTAATLNAYQYYVPTASPYAALGGNLLAQSVDYGTSLTAADFETPVLTYDGLRCSLLCNPLCRKVCSFGTWDDQVTLSSSAALGWKSVDVTGKVERDRAVRATRGNRSQFRLKFPTNTNLDGVYNAVGIYAGEAATNRPYLSVTYLYP